MVNVIFVGSAATMLAIAVAAAFLWINPPMKKEAFPTLFDKLFSFLDRIGVTLGFGEYDDDDDDSSKHVEVKLMSKEPFIKLTNVGLVKPVIIPINDNLTIQLHASFDSLCISWNWLTDFPKALRHADCYLQDSHAVIEGLDVTVTFVPWRMETRLPVGKNRKAKPKAKSNGKKSAVMAIVWQQLHFLFNALKITLNDLRVRVTNVTSTDTTLLEYGLSECYETTLLLGARRLCEERMKGQPKTGPSTNRTWNFSLDQFFVDVAPRGVDVNQIHSTAHSELDVNESYSTAHSESRRLSSAPLLKDTSLRLDWTMRPSDKFRQFWANDGLRIDVVGCDGDNDKRDGLVGEGEETIRSQEETPLDTSNQNQDTYSIPNTTSLDAQKDEMCVFLGEDQLDCVNQHVGALLAGFIRKREKASNRVHSKPVQKRKPVSLQVKRLSALSVVLPNDEKFSLAGLRLDVKFDGSEFLVQGRRGIFMSNDSETIALWSLPNGCKWMGDRVSREFLVYSEEQEDTNDSHAVVASVHVDQKELERLKNGVAALAGILKPNLSRGAIGLLRSRTAPVPVGENEVDTYWDYHVYGSLSVFYKNDMGNKANPILVEARIHSIHVVWQNMENTVKVELGEVQHLHVHGQLMLMKPVGISCDCNTSGSIWNVAINLGPIIAKLQEPHLEQQIRDSKKKQEMKEKGETIFSPSALMYAGQSGPVVSNGTNPAAQVEGDGKPSSRASFHSSDPEAQDSTQTEAPMVSSDATRFRAAKMGETQTWRAFQLNRTTKTDASDSKAPTIQIDDTTPLPGPEASPWYFFQMNRTTKSTSSHTKGGVASDSAGLQEAQPWLVLLPFTAIANIEWIRIFGVDGKTQHIEVENCCVALGPDAASIEESSNHVPTGGIRVALTVHKAEHCMVAIDEVMASAILLPHDPNTIERFQFSAQAIRVTSGYSIFSWKRLRETGDQNREKRRLTKTKTSKKTKAPPIRLPFAHIQPLKVTVDVKGEVGLNGATIHFREFKGKANTTANDLIPLYIAGVLESAPGFVRDSEFLGLKLHDGLTAGVVAVFPTGGFAGMVGYDGTKNVIDAGKRNRGALADDKYRFGDLARGVAQTGKEAVERGAVLRGHFPTPQDSPMEQALDWAVGCEADLNDYVRHNKARIAGHGGAIAGGAVGFMVGGPIAAVVGALVAFKVTEGTVKQIEEAGEVRVQTKPQLALAEATKVDVLPRLENGK